MVPLRRRRAHLPRDGVFALRDTKRSFGGAAPNRDAPSRADPSTLAARHLDGSRIADSRRRGRGELARSFFGDRLPVPSLFHLVGGTWATFEPLQSLRQPSRAELARARSLRPLAILSSESGRAMK